MSLKRHIALSIAVTLLIISILVYITSCGYGSVTFIQSIFSLPAAISLLAVAVSASAVLVSDLKLQLDLYAKRFDIYTKTLDFYFLEAKSSIIEDDDFKAKQQTFIRAVRESQFLFEQDVFDHLVQMQKTFEILMKKSDGLTGQSYVNFIMQRTEAQTSLEGRLLRLESLMEPYLGYQGTSSLGLIMRRYGFKRSRV